MPQVDRLVDLPAIPGALEDGIAVNTIVGKLLDAFLCLVTFVCPALGSVSALRIPHKFPASVLGAYHAANSPHASASD